jgi:histidyl-tRNA synthetase
MHFRRIKGTQDILPADVGKWHYVEQVIREEMAIYNFKECRTPIFEQTELFARSIGEGTDIVGKEMYTFTDRGKKSLTLKPEMTAPIMRAFLENNLNSLGPLTKIYYIAPLFRQENPQAGRLRQFHQFGAEILGSGAPELDAEVILLAMQIYTKLGLTGLNLMLNSVGDPESRQKYRIVLQDFIRPNLSRYCKDCRDRFETNPLRILDCKVESCRKLNAGAPRLIDSLTPAASRHFEDVREILKANGIGYALNPYLVRGLDYYTHTVFEITSSHLGAQDAICGGGRYDLLARELGGADTPAVGFASGIERLLMVMSAQDLLPADDGAIDVYLCALGPSAGREMTVWSEKIRGLGLKTDRDYLGRSMKAQLREANRLKASIVLILGDDEMKEHEFAVKDMKNSGQQMIPFDGIESFLLQFFRQDLP